MLNLIKNKYMIGFMILMIGITCFGSINEKKMDDNYLSSKYIENNLS